MPALRRIPAPDIPVTAPVADGGAVSVDYSNVSVAGQLYMGNNVAESDGGGPLVSK